jgi:hypothetical protein
MLLVDCRCNVTQRSGRIVFTPDLETTFNHEYISSFDLAGQNSWTSFRQTSVHRTIAYLDAICVVFCPQLRLFCSYTCSPLSNILCRLAHRFSSVAIALDFYNLPRCFTISCVANKAQQTLNDTVLPIIPSTMV